MNRRTVDRLALAEAPRLPNPIPTREARTRGGYPVTLLPDLPAGGHPIHGFIHWPAGGFSYASWDRDGGHHERTGASRSLAPRITFDLDPDALP